MKLVYFLTVDVTDELPHEIQTEIMEDAEPQDTTWRDKIERYIGGALSAGEAMIAGSLPEGFAARIEAAGKSVIT